MNWIKHQKFGIEHYGEDAEQCCTICICEKLNQTREKEKWSEELRDKIEGMKIKEKGKMIMEFGNGKKSEIMIDSDRAVFYNKALQNILELLDGK